MRGFLRLSLIQKTALALVAVGVLPLVVVSYRLVGLNRGAMTEQILRTHAVAARTAADRVNAFVDERVALASTVASHPELLSNPRSVVARELIAGILQSRDDIVAIAITNPEGEEFIRAQRRESA